METNRTVFGAMALLAIAGLLAASYVFFTHALDQPLYCPFATGCDAVQASPYASFAGVPASLLGMLGFGVYAALAEAAWRTAAWRMRILAALTLLSAVEVGFTAYLAYLQLNVIRAVCSWCMFSAGITAALALLALGTVAGLLLRRAQGGAQPLAWRHV